MKKYFITLLLSFLGIALFSQLHHNEAVNLKPKKILGNPNVFYLDGNRTLDLPAAGAFLYSSLEGDEGVVSAGYSNNEDYTITIRNQYNRRIFLRTSYFITGDNQDVLKIYDGADTQAPLLKTISGILETNFLILSSGEYLTIKFKSNNELVSKGFRLRLDHGPVIQNKPGLPLPVPMSCASTPAADECASAPLICDLNGYCGNTSGAYTAGNTSGLGNFCGSIENNSWLSFVASSTSASLIFNSAGCQDNSSGIQAVIYASTNCTSFTEVSNCESQGSGSGTFTITTNVNLVPGQTYYVMVDGFAGNICNYTVTASAGVALGQQITGPTQLCPGYSGTLSASSAASSYTWTSNPPGVYPNTQNITITPTITTTYSLTLGASACVPTGTTIVKTVTITNTLNPANITAPSPICMGSNITLASLTNGGTYAWTGPGSYTANTQNATVNNWTAANNGVYGLTITYGPGCATAPATINLTGTPVPTINIAAAPSLTVCNGQNVVLTASGGTGTNGYTWDWNLLQSGLTVTTQFCVNIPFVGLSCSASPLSIPGIGAGPSATVQTNSNTQICVSSENAAGCVGEKCVNIVVLPAAGALTVSPTSTICPGQSTTLTVSGGSSYTWTPATGLSSTSGASVTANPTVTTTYSVLAPGCSGTQTKTVQVVVNGTPPNIGTINGLTSICPNQAGVTYSVTGSASTNYTWTVPGGASITSIPTNSNAIVVNFGASAGTVSVVATSSCGTSTSSINVTLNPSLNLTVTPNSTSICSGGSVVLTASGATNYTWSPSAGLSSVNGTTVSANPALTTTYTILGATGTCTGVTTATVSVQSNLSLTVTPNNPVICPAGQANLVASGANTYTWSGSALNTASGASVTASPIVTTIYTVTGSAGTCTGVAMATVTVDNTNCNTGTCDAAQIRAALTGAGNIELLGMNDPCSLYFINPQFMTGPAAQAYAQTFGGNLISVQSAAENNSLMTALNNQGYAGQVIWIGFSDAASEGNFIWYDGAPVNYTNWNVGEPNNAGGNENCVQIYPNGTWNDLDCGGYNSLSVIEINLCPQISIASVPVHCQNTVVNLTANTLLGSPNYTYTWAQSGTETFTNTSSPGNTNQISVTSVGPNTFTVTSVDRYSCQQTSVINLQVNPTPTISVNSATICLGQTATLTANGATAYTWAPASTLNSSNSNPVTATPSVTTTYSVTGENLGCTSTATTSVRVEPLPNIYIIQQNSTCDTSILNWVNVTSVTPGLAQGTLPSGITVSATHSGGGMSTTPSMYSGGTFPATYSVPIAATTIRNDLGGTFNFCFSQPVINPQIAFASIGNASTPITINTGTPYQIVWPGVNMTYISNTSMIGTEGFTIIRFPGLHTCISLDYIGDESYCNLAFGVMDMNCQDNPICPGEPIQLIANGASTYTWSTGAQTNSISPNPSTTTSYTVNGSSAFGCSGSAVTTVSVNPTPTITVNNSTICVGQQTATLTANGGTTYTWNPSATLSSANGTSVTGTPASTTNYTVSGTDMNGCIGNATSTITVNPLPTITANSATICLGQQTATLIANGANTYSWNPSADLSAASGATVTGNPISSTNYTVTGTDLNGCTNIGTSTITVVNIPTITVSSNATICPLSNTVLIAGGATNYTWVPSTGLNNTNTATVTANPNSSTTYSVGGIDNNGCVSGNTVQVTVVSNPTIVAASNSTICPAGSATLNVNGGTSYTWTPSNSLSSANGSSVVSTPSVTTTYTVTGENLNGCTSTHTVEVFVANTPTITVSPDVTVCPMAITSLTVGGANTYSWSPSTYLNATNSSSVLSTPNNSISYTVTGTTLSGCTNTANVNVTVSNTVVVNASASTSTICPNGNSILSATGASSYTWSPSISLNAANGSSVIAAPSSNETYTVIGSTSTCTNSALVVITVTTNPVISVTSATICSGTNASLTASGASSYTWTPSIFLNTNTGANVTANPPSTKGYTVLGTSALGCIGAGSTTVSVTQMPNTLVSANPISICPGETSGLTASGATSYSWTPALTLSNATGPATIASPTITTTYSVTGINGVAPTVCTTTKTVEVIVKPTTTVTVGTPDPICYGSSTKLEAHGGTMYSWQPTNSLTPPIDSVVVAHPLSNTIYTVTVNQIGYCPATATVEVIVNPLPYVYAGVDTITNIDEAITLYGIGDTQVGFLSNDNDPLNCNLCPIITVNPYENTCYILKGTSNQGCTNFDTVCVTVTKDWNVYIPNAFTPDGDGLNDTFSPKGYAISEIHMLIFDRWGEVIFKSDPEHQAWDGKYKGVVCAQGVYVYQIEVISMGGASLKKTGHVTVLPLKR